MRCPACGADNSPGRRFCRQCGSALALSCPACGAANEPDDRFCGQCGGPLSATAPAASQTAAQPQPAQAERRLVSVLFADLVGFTHASEGRDPEDVRDLLTRYFDECRRVVELYGGTVEKFIGDALMALWGAPVTNEDDSERAVRAALELVDAVAALGQQHNLPGLQARAAVMTGEAAVTLGAVGQGMVAGDLVNSASRAQGLAEPGTVLVSDTTHRLTEAAVVYEDTGRHAVKGKDEPLHLWRPLRVVAARGGSQRSSGLEPPFIGRDRELRLLKELFHASAEERRAHLVSVTGIAGIGKSRLGWEFFKYLDGVALQVRYHAGRCLAYGEGVTYWALAEIVRRRVGIVEGETSETQTGKLRASLEELIAEEEERRWLEPRLAVLLGLGEGAGADGRDLFAAWRRFFELLADSVPTVLVFEDMQWADPALVEFIDYLLEWSRGYPLFVLALGRPSADKGFSGGRNQTQLHLEPLSRESMRSVVEQMVPGLPEDVVQTVVERSEGVPLYAVETVRMLLDKGLLTKDGGSYRTAAPLESLEVPESLHGLIAARLDGLTPDERRAVHDVAVLGKTFTLDAAAFVTQRPAEEVGRLLDELLRKDILAVQADPRSPERGQYGFVQDLVREVAYDTLSRRDRRDRHLRVAEYLERSALTEADVAEVLASHYAEAYRASEDAPDAPEIRAKAREMFTRAGNRSASVGAPEQAQGYFEQALSLADDDLERAALLKRAGEMATTRGRFDRAFELLGGALEIYERAGQTREAALVSVAIGHAGFTVGKFHESIESLTRAVATLEQAEGPELAATLAQLGRLLVFAGEMGKAKGYLERALSIAERLNLPDTFSNALNSKGIVYLNEQRPQEAETLLRKALEVAESADLPVATMRALNNLQTCLSQLERLEEDYEVNERGIAHARRIGDQVALMAQIAGPIGNLMLLGRWDEAVARRHQAEEFLVGTSGVQWGQANLLVIAPLYANRGEYDEAKSILDRFAGMLELENQEDRAFYLHVRAAVANAAGRHEDALRDAGESLRLLESEGGGVAWMKYYAAEYVEAALRSHQLAVARAGMARLWDLPPGQLTPFARGSRDTLDARLRIAEGSTEGVDELFRSAASTFGGGGLSFDLAISQLHHAEWLAGQGRAEEARKPLAEAKEIFERLKARPWIERAGGLRLTETEASVAT